MNQHLLGGFRRRRIEAFLGRIVVLSAALTFCASLARAHLIQVDPADYAGQWNVAGVWHTGPADVDLPAGSHTIAVGDHNSILVDVDATGNVTSLSPTKASSSGNTLTFLTSVVNIDAAAYLGQWEIRRASAKLTGFQSLALVPDGRYIVSVGDFNTFFFDVDAAGNVTSLSPTKASTSGNTLTFLTSVVNIDAAAYLGQWEIRRASAKLTGFQSLALVPDGRYIVSVGDFNTFFFDVDAAGNVTSLNTKSATASADTLTLITASISFDVGVFSGQWNLGRASAKLTGDQLLDLVPDGQYIFATPDGDVFFNISSPCAIDNPEFVIDGFTFKISCAGIPVIDTLVDIDPDTLNLKSHGRWITAYITLPDGFDVNDIDTSTIAITGLKGGTCAPDYTQLPDTSFTPVVGDRDEDLILDLTVKFDRQLLLANICLDDVDITIEGDLITGEHFVGADSIRVIDRGKP